MTDTRPLRPCDFEAAHALYRALSASDQIAPDPAQFRKVLDHAGTTLWGAFDRDALAAMVTLHLMPNMTYGGRPYGLIENVITAAPHRGKGHGRRALSAAIDAARRANAYKLMLLTGSRRNAVGFYQSLGFSGDEKHGMILRL